MIDVTRRHFLTCAGMTAAAAGLLKCNAYGRADDPAAPEADLEGAIAAERNNVLETMHKANIPGVAVCLVHGGELAWLEGFGVTGESGQPVTPDTLFSIQSTSKNITATGVMLAVQSGMLDLDTPVTAYLPDFKVFSRYEPHPQAQMTLRLLLSHRAGFTHEAPAGNNYEPQVKDFQTHVRSISQTWLRCPVAERYRYSNLGFDLAGYILEVKTGMPLSEWLRTRLFEKLGMMSTTLAPEVYCAQSNRALGHSEGHRTVPLVTPLVASGGVYTTARDMARYSRFHLSRGRVGGAALLREALWQEMHKFSSIGDYRGGDYGLGVIRTDLRYGDTPLRMMSHQGGGFGFGCVFNYCPQAGIAWTALCNRAAGYHLGDALLDAALRMRHGARRPLRPFHDLAPIKLSAAQQRPYIGNYVGRTFSANIEQHDGLLLLKTDAGVTPLIFTSPREGWTGDAQAEAVAYRRYAQTALAPAHLECMRGEESLDYNEGPQDPPGPDRPAWTAFLGQYRIEQWGVPSETATIHKKNGYLYINHIRLITEHEPGLFFSSDGEALDFRGANPLWRNILLHRMG